MTFLLPQALQMRDDGDALGLLQRYYKLSADLPDAYRGSAFDAWDSTGTRAADQNVFTADDLVAVTFLSIDVDARAAYSLLVSRREEFSALLAEVGPDRDLVTQVEPFADDGPEWRLEASLRSLTNVGPTTASKLFARKRPRLRAIYDSVVDGVTGGQQAIWEPLRQELRANDQALHQRLVALRQTARLAEAVSPLRIFDVVAWMEGKTRGF